MAKRGRRDDTKERILDCTQALIQTRGYNGFSYRDVAAEVDIRSASIHYHFPKKADLVAAVARRYASGFMAQLESAGKKGKELPGLLAVYAGLFRQAVAKDRRMCLCGILGAEGASLPAPVAAEAKRFFNANTEWLTRQFEDAAVDRPATEARLLLATLEGAMILAKVEDDVGVFDEVAEAALARFGPT